LVPTRSVAMRDAMALRIGGGTSAGTKGGVKAAGAEQQIARAMRRQVAVRAGMTWSGETGFQTITPVQNKKTSHLEDGRRASIPRVGCRSRTHLPGSPVGLSTCPASLPDGCWGFNGPLPLPLWMRSCDSSLVAENSNRKPASLSIALDHNGFPKSAERPNGPGCGWA
jgi:hypothetical protein